MKLGNAQKAFHAMASAVDRVTRVNREVGEMVGPAFVNSGLYKYVNTSIEAEVAFHRLVAVLQDEAEWTEFRREVAKRAPPVKKRGRKPSAGKSNVSEVAS